MGRRRVYVDLTFLQAFQPPRLRPKGGSKHSLDGFGLSRMMDCPIQSRKIEAMSHNLQRQLILVY